MIIVMNMKIIKIMKNIIGKSETGKVKRIILIVVISMVILTLLVWNVGIRLIILYLERQITPKLGPAAEYFTEFDLTMADSEAVQVITINDVTITIPAEFEETEPLGTTRIFSTIDEEGNVTKGLLILTPGDVSEINLLGEQNMDKMAANFWGKYAVKQLVKGYEDLGYGIPDNFYNMSKSYYLLKEEDYSFWNWRKELDFFACC